jgi:peptidoglycan/xylan/chitin deacetylase (PgdA/CDA1 family)/glycosyltransferase involved in cell wall biosynthesis
MKISIIVPARNEEKHISACLKSLKDQTYQGDYEIVVVDNNSTDKTAEIARSFGVRVIRATKERNVFYARQVGADSSKGDIIVQADGDTLYPRYWLEKIAKKFEEHPEAVALSGRFLYREFFFWAWVELPMRDLMNKISAKFFGRPFLVCGATFAFRREAFYKVGGYKDIPYSADQHGITTKFRELGKVLYDNKIYVLTSARSVRQSQWVLLMAVVGNLGRLMYDYSLNLIAAKPKPIPMSLRKRLALALSVMLACFIGFSCYGYFSPVSPVFGEVYYAGNTSEKVVALTFDDGPNGIYTTQILDILDRYGIDATFFVIGKNVELYPDIAKRILSDGSVLANHSYSHDANHALTTFGERDLEKAQEVIYSITGVLPHLYRPPHGKKTPWEIDCVKENNMIEITWSVSYNDQVGFSADLIKAAENFAAKIVSKTSPGSIILLHDGYGLEHDSQHADRSLTILALPLIIEQLQAQGYRFVTVPVLLNVPAYNEAN